VKSVIALTVLLCATALAAAQTGVQDGGKDGAAPPAKRVKAERAPRPAGPINVFPELSPPQEAYAAFPDAAAAAAATPAAPSACQRGLAAIATFRPIPVLVGPGECGAVDAVLLDAVTLADRTKVPLTPPATLRCPMADAIAHWVREDVAPAAIKAGAPLRGLDNFDSYECRGRNRVLGAKISEHGRANALDVRGIKLADGRTLGLTDVNVDKAWRESIRATACARFSTVLGPGSDGYHEEHIHLDLAERRNNYKTCQWDVREPVPPSDTAALPDAAGPDESEEPEETVPLPRPRPSKQIGAALRRAAAGFDGSRGNAPQ
jgi:hypothetical protein